MTKNGLRGFAAGIFVSCGLLAIYTYILHPISNQPNQAEGAITSTQVDHYLAQKGQIAVDQATFDKWSNDQKAAQSSSNSKTKSQTTSKADTSTQTKEPSPSTPTVTKMTINVTGSMGVWDVAKELEAKHIIKDKQSLYDYMLHHKLDKYLQLGSFNVSSQMTTEQIANVLSKH
jgi:hypothetical protein